MDWSAMGSGLVGVITGSGVVLLVIRAKFDRLADLERTVEVSQANRLSANEAKVAELEKAGAVIASTLVRHEEALASVNPALLSNQIEVLGQQNHAIEAKLDKVLEAVARLEERQRSAQADIDRAHHKISQLRP
jgi:chromosome segregation ATPase